MRHFAKKTWLMMFLLSCFFGCLWMTSVLPSVVVAAPLEPSDPSADRYTFDPRGLLGQAFTYSLTTTGSIHVQTPDEVGQTDPIQLSAIVRVLMDPSPGEGIHPLTLHLVNVRSEGFPDDLSHTLTGVIMTGQVSAQGAIIRLDTPESLSRLGIDSLDLFSGLFVPQAQNPLPPRSHWNVTLTRPNLGLNQTRSLRLNASYTHQGLQYWGERPLQSVTFSIRGNTSWREGSGRTEIREVGSGLFFVDPTTGLTSVSSVSKEITFDVFAQRLGTVHTRNVLTTTLELLDGPAPITDPIASEGVTPPADNHVTPAESLWTYHDPAGRFNLSLPSSWYPADVTLGLRSTTIVPTSNAENLYVYVHVVPLPNAGAGALTIARLALTTYQETLNGFQLLSDLEPLEINGEAAYRALYAYEDEAGEKIEEWGLFTRRQDRAYYVQVAAPGGNESPLLPDHLMQVATGFRFGPSPRGLIAAEQLPDTLKRYDDPDGHFSLLVPALWPLVDRASGGATTTFTEIGNAGYLTVFAQPGATGLTAHDIVASWKRQWEQEDDFNLIQDLTPATLSGHDGVQLEYRWSTNPQTQWGRRLRAIVVDDYLFAVALDYIAAGFADRAETFDRILASLSLSDHRRDDVDESGGDEGTPASPADDVSLSETYASDSTESPSRLPAVMPPRSADDVIFLGRFLMRYPKDGELIPEPVANVDVRINVNDSLFTATTDEDGYFIVPNLPGIREGHLYLLTHLEGALFGFDRVGVNLDNLGFSPQGPNVVTAGTVTLTLDEQYTITLDIERDTAEGPGSPLARFIRLYPTSPWSTIIQRQATPSIPINE